MNTESLSSILPPELMAVRYKPLFIFQIEVKPPSIVGATPGHDRRIGEIAGGRFEGEALRGKILSGGSDWQSLRADGATTLNVRLGDAGRRWGPDRNDVSRCASRAEGSSGSHRPRR
jgi:hypothetical protein